MSDFRMCKLSVIRCQETVAAQVAPQAQSPAGLQRSDRREVPIAMHEARDVRDSWGRAKTFWACSASSRRWRDWLFEGAGESDAFARFLAARARKSRRQNAPAFRSGSAPPALDAD